MLEEISILGAFIGGMAWFFSPCIFPLIPSYISQILGVSWDRINEHPKEYQRTFLIRGSLFILGFSLVFVLLGAGASGIGVFLRENISLLQKIGGIFIIIFGLLIVFQKIIWLRFLNRKIIFKVGGPFLLGISFSTGITLCTAPILASILVLASLQVSFIRGMVLLIFFSFGLAIPFLVITLILGRLTNLLGKISRFLVYIQVGSGIILILLGILVYNGYLSTIAAGLAE